MKMKKSWAKNWAKKANDVGFVNVQVIETAGVRDYFLDCGGFAWCSARADVFDYFCTLLESSTKINYL